MQNFVPPSNYTHIAKLHRLISQAVFSYIETTVQYSETYQAALTLHLLRLKQIRKHTKAKTDY